MGDAGGGAVFVLHKKYENMFMFLSFYVVQHRTRRE